MEDVNQSSMFALMVAKHLFHPHFLQVVKTVMLW